MIYPDSTFRSFVDATSFILLLMISLYVPFLISFNIDTSLTFNYFEVFLDLWFISEIIINFYTGYYERGVLVMTRKKIVANYVRGWLTLDIISSMPLSFLDIALFEALANGSSISVY